jgi:predicted O-methyltransferase YrrM
VAGRNLTITDELEAYLSRQGVREPEVLKRLRAETAPLPQSDMQINAVQGGFLQLLVRLTGAKRVLEVGTFTGYSSTAMALALPADGRITCCDVSREWTDVARRFWTDAGVADRVDLRLGPAIETLDGLLADGAEGTYDLAFIDADKPNYDGYYERALHLVRPGGLIAIDNTLWSGHVADSSIDDTNTNAIRALNDKVAKDERVDPVILPIADGMTLALVR